MGTVNWLVVLTILKNMSQWEGLSHILWKIKNVPNQQPVKRPAPSRQFGLLEHHQMSCSFLQVMHIQPDDGFFIPSRCSIPL